MQARMRVQGNDGYDSYLAGAVASRDSEWLRRMLANGLAEPLDGEARTFCAIAFQVERHRNEVLIQRARELGLQDQDIPACKLAGAAKGA